MVTMIQWDQWNSEAGALLMTAAGATQERSLPVLPKRTIPRVCEQCGKPFLAAVNEVARGKARFCSPACVNPPVEVRFWAKVRKGAECWEWVGAHTSRGYGNFWSGSRYVAAHIFAYSLLVGSVPRGLDLDHLCRNRSCVNPEHLEPVTRRENTLRGETPAARNARKTHCLRGHVFDEANTYRSKRGRGCRACRNASSRRLRARRAAEKRAREVG